jgi:hypothetical protein
MLTEAEPKLRRRRNESSCGAPVARFGVWVVPLSVEESENEEGWWCHGPPALWSLSDASRVLRRNRPVVDTDIVDQAGPRRTVCHALVATDQKIPR